MNHRRRSNPDRRSATVRRVVMIAPALGLSASCGDADPPLFEVGEATSELLNACGPAGTASSELAQAAADLCAPHYANGSNATKRECVFDRNDAGDAGDGDIDTCPGGTTWDAADISGLTTASGTAGRYWAITDAGGKTRERCGDNCSSGEDVEDPAYPSASTDCNGSGKQMYGSKWLFLLGGTGTMSIVGQTLVVGHRSGGVDLDVVDPEALSRFTRSSGGEHLVIVDGGLQGGSPNPCEARGVCKAIKAGTGSPAHCITDPVNDATCTGADHDTEAECRADTDCAWIKEPAEFTASREGTRYAMTIFPEPNPDDVATRGATGDYDALCIQSDAGAGTASGAWIYFKFPSTGCGGVGSSYPCPPESASHAASSGLFNIEGSAVVREKVGAQTYNTLLLFSKPPLWRTNHASCSDARIYRDVNGDGSGLGATDVRIDHGYTSVFKIANIDQYAMGSVYGAAAGTEIQATLVAQLDLEKDFSNFPSMQGQRIGDAAYVPDPAVTDQGWLLFGSQQRLYKRRWRTTLNSLNKPFFTSGSCEATQITEAQGGQNCPSAVCLPEFESMTGRVTAGVLTTYHAGESARKTTAGGVQHPAPLAKVVQGDGQRTVFVTSGKYTGNLGGTAGANAKCAAMAATAGLTGTFKAWVSTPATPASTNITTHSPYPYVKTDGAAIAGNWTDLTDGTLATAFDRDEYGALAGSGSQTVWTGTSTNGATGSIHCSSWTTSGSGSSGLVGVSYTTSGSWTASGSAACSGSYALYCIRD